MVKVCKLCGKEKEEVSLLIQGKNQQCVCNECINYYYDILQQYSKVPSRSLFEHHNIITPLEIKNELDRKMVGQDFAKKMISLAIHDQELKIANSLDDIRNNVLLIGPTGVGKTYLMELVSAIIDVPLVICDATIFSEVGYVGADVASMVEQLFEKSGYDEYKAERGIIYIDEIDKTGLKGNYHANNRDVSGEGVQQALLKLIEGKSIEVNSRRGKAVLNTNNIMFVFGGSFTGLDYTNDLTRELIQYGLIPELVGRIQIIAPMYELNEEELVKVACGVEDSIVSKQSKLFSYDGIELVINEDAIDYLAKIAYSKGLGARGIIAQLTCLLNSLRYECLENNMSYCLVDYESVKQLIENNVMMMAK